MGDIIKTAEKLTKHGFDVHLFKTSAEAKDAVLKTVGGSSVGIGGSVTIRDMGLYETLKEKGNEVIWHWMVPEEEVRQTRNAAKLCEYYLTSSNAITETGNLVNIDGSGNRVAAMFDGPAHTIIVAGHNKIVADYESAIERIQTKACGPNARRLNLNTPCRIDDRCHDCNAAQRMCRIIVSLQRPPTGGWKKISVFIVEEDLGC